MSLEGGSVTVTSYKYGFAGGLIGFASESTTIENCRSTGSIGASSEMSLPLTFAGGLIGYASGALTMKGCYNTGQIDISPVTDGGIYAGGLIGAFDASLTDSEISGCYNTSPISISTAAQNAQIFLGGIIGQAEMMSAGMKVIYCHNTGGLKASATVMMPDAYVGGVIGRILNVSGSFTVANCYNTGPVSSDMTGLSYAGGIIGYSYTDSGTAKVAECYNTGEVKASSSGVEVDAGGIIGRMNSESSSVMTVTDCYNRGNVSITAAGSAAFSGGIVGYVYTSSSYSYMINCYNTGIIKSPSSANARGIAGRAFGAGATAINCYFLQGTAGTVGSAALAIDGASDPARKTDGPDQRSGARTAAEMRPDLADAKAPDGGNSIYYTGDTGGIAGWDFRSVWTIKPEENDGYPVLQSSFNAPVYFIQGPEDRTVKDGGTAIFCVSVWTPGIIPKYQWHISTDGGLTWEEIAGSEGMSHACGPVSMDDDGMMFRVSVTVPGYIGGIMSDGVTLFVVPLSPCTCSSVCSVCGLCNEDPCCGADLCVCEPCVCIPCTCDICDECNGCLTEGCGCPDCPGKCVCPEPSVAKRSRVCCLLLIMAILLFTAIGTGRLYMLWKEQQDEEK